MIPRTVAANWRNAFRSKAIWEELGFDYVPIEPIYSREEIVNKLQLKSNVASSLVTLTDSVDPQSELVFSPVLTGPSADDGSWFYVNTPTQQSSTMGRYR